MGYATRTDLEHRFGAGEIAALAEDKDNPGFDRTVAALAHADAVIDSYLAVAYALPLPAGRAWPILREIACDMARGQLYDDSPLEEPKERQSRGIRRLEALRDGGMNLVDSNGAAAPRTNTAERIGPKPVFDQSGLQGF